MRKTVIFITIAALIGACGGFGLSYLFKIDGTGYIPGLKITGDVLGPYSLKSLNDFKKTNIDNKGKTVESVGLKDIIDKSKPVTEDSVLVFIGDDGLAAQVDNKNLDGCHILFSADNGWEAVNDYHPISSNIKRIKEIVVVSNNPPTGYGVGIISQEKNIMHLTPGSMRMMGLTSSLRFEGKSSVGREGTSYSTSVYTSHNMVKLSDLTEIKSYVLIMGDEGKYSTDDGNGYLEVLDNSIDYVTDDLKHSIKNISGIMVDTPKRSVMDAYYDSQNLMDMGEDVLLIYIDGFGYHQYTHAVDNGYAPCLKSLPRADRASTVYRPVTNAGFAAMITGKGPDENGVYSRAQKDMKVKSIFGELKDMGRKATLIEGNIKILNTEIEPVLNVDKNSNGSCDDEIYEYALAHMNDGNNFMLVHFHSVDDSGTEFGDMDERTMNAISVVDGYIKDLVSRWKGRVIITADHGIHSIENGGEHSSFICEDMIVPYLITEGGVK